MLHVNTGPVPGRFYKKKGGGLYLEGTTKKRGTVRQGSSLLSNIFVVTSRDVTGPEPQKKWKFVLGFLGNWILFLAEIGKKNPKKIEDVHQQSMSIHGRVYMFITNRLRSWVDNVGTV